MLLMVAVLVLVITLPEPAGIRANPAQPKRVSARHRFTCPKRSGLEPGDPCRISIPSIKVVAKVIRLGLNPDGTLEVPSDFSVTGWWSGGTRPGTIGPAVIVGHVDSVAGAAVFYHLRDLHRGAVVKVWRVGRPMVRYRLDRMIQVPKNDFPTDQVYGDTPFAAIRLITCGGAFDRSSGNYLDNVVAYARLTAVEA